MIVSVEFDHHILSLHLSRVCMYAYTCVYNHVFTVSLFVDLIMLLDAAI